MSTFGSEISSENMKVGIICHKKKWFILNRDLIVKVFLWQKNAMEILLIFQLLKLEYSSKRLQFAKMQVRQLLFEMEFLKLPLQPPVLGSSAADVNCGHVS